MKKTAKKNNKDVAKKAAVKKTAAKKPVEKETVLEPAAEPAKKAPKKAPAKKKAVKKAAEKKADAKKAPAKKLTVKKAKAEAVKADEQVWPDGMTKEEYAKHIADHTENALICYEHKNGKVDISTVQRGGMYREIGRLLNKVFNTRKKVKQLMNKKDYDYLFVNVRINGKKVELCFLENRYFSDHGSKHDAVCNNGKKLKNIGEIDDYALNQTIGHVYLYSEKDDTWYTKRINNTNFTPLKVVADNLINGIYKSEEKQKEEAKAFIKEIRGSKNLTLEKLESMCSECSICKEKEKVKELQKFMKELGL